MYTDSTTNSLSQADFIKLSRFIYEQSGIKMPDSKKIMVEARLRKRLRELNFSSYSDYCEFLFSKEGEEKELRNMVDIITTNKTDFFREPKQFTFLEETALPALLKSSGAGICRPVKIWSAGCSTGEEPYTIAMVLNEFSTKVQRYTYHILATDISTKVLRQAYTAVYEDNKVTPIPNDLLRKYFLKSKDSQKKLLRVVPALRNMVKFQWLNFMDNDFGLDDKFDIIFCRNVIIYFDKQTQDILIEKLLKYLNPGGFLLLGHSESIFNTNLPLVQLAASTYRKIQ